MKVHGNAALGPAGRLALVEAIESGMTPATAHRWWHRWRLAGERERKSGAWLRDRSSRPRRQPRRLSAAEEESILRARRQTNLGPGRLAGICRRARSTIWKVLWRHGLSRRAGARRETYRRYEWSRPGALLHVDVARLARFERPGHAVTGNRADRNRGAGYVYLHCVIDDHSRYAYVEQDRDQGGETAALVLARSIEHFAALGLAPPEAVMSDNAFAYRNSRAFRAVLKRHGSRHILTPPYTPRWNGKVERFIQTLKREWAFAHSWASSTERTRAMAPALLQPASPSQLIGRPAADQPRSQRPWVGQLDLGGGGLGGLPLLV
jgi:transposase InsO family protein